MEDIIELREEIERLRDRNHFLLKQITGQINCSYFCALPECFDQLAKGNHDNQNCKNSQTAF